MSAMTYDQAIEHAGYGRFQRKLMVICGLGWAADAMEVLLIVFALPAIGEEWGLDNTQKRLLGTAIFLGMLVGAWRWLLGLSAVPGLIVFFIWRDVPESPRYLPVSGQNEQARRILEQVAHKNGRSLPAGELIAPPAVPRGRIRDLWSPSMGRTTLLLWVIWFAISLGYYGVFTWLPSYFYIKGHGFAARVPKHLLTRSGAAPRLLFSRLPG